MPTSFLCFNSLQAWQTKTAKSALLRKLNLSDSVETQHWKSNWNCTIRGVCGWQKDQFNFVVLQIKWANVLRYTSVHFFPFVAQKKANSLKWVFHQNSSRKKKTRKRLEQSNEKVLASFKPKLWRKKRKSYLPNLDRRSAMFTLDELL